MTSMPILVPPPNWSNPDIVLYHGTVNTYSSIIVSGRIRVSAGKPRTDFGPGFYTTTVKLQAQMWAAQISATKPGTRPAVVQLTIKRDQLANLESLSFVRGDFDADHFWSLVHHCRKGALNHGRTGTSTNPNYDVVYGPVAAFWNQRMCIASADQISFHTNIAEGVLNGSAMKEV